MLTWTHIGVKRKRSYPYYNIILFKKWMRVILKYYISISITSYKNLNKYTEVWKKQISFMIF